jgi:large subunit ribosomal protein L2
MGLKTYKPTTPSRRYITMTDFGEVTRPRPEKSLLAKFVCSGGRNNSGRETNINIGGGHKRRYRLVDFKRDKNNIPGKVVAIEYDPNRSARIALVHYADGEKRYMVAPIGLEVGHTVVSAQDAEIKAGNALPLRNIPTGIAIHNIELKRGAGAKLVRSAGGAAQLVAKEGEYGTLRLPSGETRKVHLDCLATIGQVGNLDKKNVMVGKAGRSRWLGRRPHNRGTSKNPVDHPLGGGEGKSKGGRHPCSPTGVLAKGLKTRHNKRTSKFIIKRRNSKGGA